jgi:hypothetical protein
VAVTCTNVLSRAGVSEPKLISLRNAARITPSDGQGGNNLFGGVKCSRVINATWGMGGQHGLTRRDSMRCCDLSTCWCSRLHVLDGTFMWWTSGPRGTYGQTRDASRLATARSAAGRSGGRESKGLHFWKHWVMLKLSITSNDIACVGAASGAPV